MTPIERAARAGAERIAARVVQGLVEHLVDYLTGRAKGLPSVLGAIDQPLRSQIAAEALAERHKVWESSGRGGGK